MGKLHKLLLTSGSCLALATGCGHKKNKEGDSSANSGTGTVNSIGGAGAKGHKNAAQARLNLAQAFDANTPASFKTGPAASLSLADACQDAYGADSAEATACRTMADIKSRFFDPSPTNIHDRLADADQGINGTVKSLSDGYVPCLDANRSAAEDFDVFVTGAGNKTVTYPPFALKPVPIRTVYGDGTVLDTGDTLQLSCFSPNLDGTKGGTGYGNDAAGNWHYYDFRGGAGGMAAIASPADDIELWYDVSSITAGSAAEEREKGDALYPGSTGIVQIISHADSGIMGLVQVGAGIGPGCGAQLIMNSHALYFKGPVNNYGACYADDYAAGGPDGRPAYDATRDAVEVCMTVDGATITPTLGLTECLKSGLIAVDDDGNTVSPFKEAGLKTLTADPNSKAPDAIKVRAWMAGQFMRDLDYSDIPVLAKVANNGAAAADVVGFARNSYALTRTTASGNVTTSVKAACNAAASARQAAMSETFAFTVADLLKERQKFQADFTADQMVAELKAALAQTGDAAPTLQAPVTGTAGTTFRGTFTGTATLKVDAVDAGSADLAMPAADGRMAAAGKIAVAGAANLTSDSQFTVEVTGTLELSCDNKNDRERQVATKAAVPVFTWYHASQSGDAVK